VSTATTGPGEPAPTPDGADADGGAGPGAGGRVGGGDGLAVQGSASGAARRRSALRQSVADMLRTMAVILAIVAVVFFLVPRPTSLPQARVDVARSASEARSALGFAPSVPVLPAGWTATQAEVRSGADGVVTWHLGFQTPGGRYAALEQAERSTYSWENILTSGGDKVGTVEISGLDWEHVVRADRAVDALIHRGTNRVTLVTSKEGGLAEATALAAALPVATLSGPAARP